MSFITAAQVQQNFDDSNPITAAQYANFVTTHINKQIKSRRDWLGHGHELELTIPIHKGNLIASLSLWEAYVNTVVTQLGNAGWVGRTEVKENQTIIFISLP
jgi:hypothetical protein